MKEYIYEELEKYSKSLDIEFDADELNPDLKINPWNGHRKLIYELILQINPMEIVELGSHFGCSLFAMAQAIKDNNFETVLNAIDTWEGDEHAGFYDSSVFDIVNKTKNIYFNDISLIFHKMTFDEALASFENNSVDLIHIDGLHTYEATKHDFETWLPKLRKDGIVIFHDIANYTGYGSSKFWSEIKLKYDHFEVFNSWGLGILFPKGNKFFKKLNDINFKLFLFANEYIGFKIELEENLRWQKKQADKNWEEKEKLKEDLAWQKKQADKNWEEREKLKEDLAWQKKQADKNWEEREKLKEDLAWQKKQMEKTLEETEKLK